MLWGVRQKDKRIENMPPRVIKKRSHTQSILVACIRKRQNVIELVCREEPHRYFELYEVPQLLKLKWEFQSAAAFHTQQSTRHQRQLKPSMILCPGFGQGRVNSCRRQEGQGWDTEAVLHHVPPLPRWGEGIVFLGEGFSPGQWLWHRE